MYAVKSPIIFWHGNLVIHAKSCETANSIILCVHLGTSSRRQHCCHQSMIAGIQGCMVAWIFLIELDDLKKGNYKFKYLNLRTRNRIFRCFFFHLPLSIPCPQKQIPSACLIPIRIRLFSYHVTLEISLKRKSLMSLPIPTSFKPATRVRCQYSKGNKLQIKPCKLAWGHIHDKESKTCQFILEKIWRTYKNRF